MLAARIRSISAQCILHKDVREDLVGQISRIILEATIMTITTQLEDEILAGQYEKTPRSFYA